MIKQSIRVLRSLLALCLFLAVFQLIFINPQPVSAANGGWLHTSGNRILNSSNQEVGISGVNWFGFETGTGAPDGLSTRPWWFILDQMKEEGYNTIRIPFSNQVLNPGHMPQSIDYNIQNPDLRGLNSIQIMDKLIDGARQRGLKVILDNHRSNNGVSAQESGLWYTADYPESRWISDWQFITNRYKNDDTVVGMDLRNEPHDAACWGCGDPLYDWRLAAEKAGNAILAINPNLLIFVEGVECFGLNGANVPPPPGQPNPNNVKCTWWGGNLMGAKDYPVRLSVANRLVYSPHEYPASVYAQPWFSDPTYPANMPAVWETYWGYLHTSNTAPLMFGEFGTRLATASDRTWFTAFTDYIRTKGHHWTYWSWNPNSGDTGGLVMDDWMTVVREKQNILDTIQYPLLGVMPTPTPTRTGGGVTPGSLKVQYRAANTAASAMDIKPFLSIVNVDAGTVDLSTIKVRYYLTKDSSGALQVFCDWAAMAGACANITRTSGTFSGTDADSFIEIGFTAAAGSLMTGASTGEIQLRASKSDFQNFTQTNDYSFDATKTAFADWTKVTLHQNGVLIWGTPPGGTTATNTPGVPTNTSVPPTATRTPALPTNTPAGPTATRTNTPVPPTATRTSTRTNTPAGPTATRTNTPIGPTATRTNTPVQPTATRTNTPVPTTAVPGAFKVQYKAADTATGDNQMKPHFNIVNTGTSSAPLTEFKLRYYFTRDTAQNLVFNCDYAIVGCANITATFVAVSPAKTNADYYLEIGFTSGTLPANGGSSGGIQTRLNKSDWSNFNESNDYSFDPTKINFADWNRVTLYRNGVLVWGTEP